jgi:hypothetical protein
MRRILLAAAAAALAIAVALVPFRAGLAQEANRAEMEAITQIARCMASGLPEDWATAHMIVELRRPGEATGNVRYLVLRKDAEDKPEPFTPCDTDEPPTTLIGLRALQPAERQGWTAARLVVERDGTFRLNYDFPK